MKCEEIYYGHKIVITTTQPAEGRWMSKAELPDLGEPKIVLEDSERYNSEKEAKRIALSRPAGVIDQIGFQSASRKLPKRYFITEFIFHCDFAQVILFQKR